MADLLSVLTMSQGHLLHPEQQQEHGFKAIAAVQKNGQQLRGTVT